MALVCRWKRGVFLGVKGHGIVKGVFVDADQIRWVIEDCGDIKGRYL